QRVAGRDDHAVAEHVRGHADPGHAAVHLRHRVADRLRVRADGRHRIRRLLVDLHRLAAAGDPARARGSVQGPAQRRAGGCRKAGAGAGGSGGLRRPARAGRADVGPGAAQKASQTARPRQVVTRSGVCLTPPGVDISRRMRPRSDSSRRFDDLIAVIESTRALSSAADIPEAMSMFARELTLLFDASACLISSYDPETQAVTDWAAHV